MFYFHPYLGKITQLTNIFQMGWNHQLVKILIILMVVVSSNGKHSASEWFLLTDSEQNIEGIQEKQTHSWTYYHYLYTIGRRTIVLQVWGASLETSTQHYEDLYFFGGWEEHWIPIKVAFQLCSEVGCVESMARIWQHGEVVGFWKEQLTCHPQTHLPKTYHPKLPNSLKFRINPSKHLNQQISPYKHRPSLHTHPSQISVISLRRWSNLFWVVLKNSLAKHPANQKSSLKRIWYQKYRSLAHRGGSALKEDGNTRRIWFG